MPVVRIALANIPPPTFPADATRRAVAAVADAGAAGALVVCLPEAYVPGYRYPDQPSPLVDAASLEGAWRRVRDAAAAARTAVVLGTERLDPGGPRLAALVIDRDGSVLGWQDKAQLDPSEDAGYAPGDGHRHVFTVGPLRFGVAICHEGWRYPETVRAAARAGAHVVFHPHVHEGDPGGYAPATFCDPANTFHEKALLCRAAENTVYVASVNVASPGSGTTSAVIRPDGSVQCWQPYGVEGLLVADIDTATATGLLAHRCRAPYPVTGTPPRRSSVA
ncbi:MAG: carbon-nitrogen hydrolase family protein [Thermoleophilia bacterium]|nr:carbon-nitrogen hydrolase family protein [Thermoleophilia bacterium]